MGIPEGLNDRDIAVKADKFLEIVQTLTDDPYCQIAILRSAAHIIENRLTATATKAAITAALTNMIPTGYIH
jgi:hypothetical protein